MGQIENNICDAINILVNKAISGIQLDKTVSCTIEECVDEGLNQYRVKYQDSSFLAYAQGDNKYRKNTKVYVLIPSNDITEDRIILGTIDKLGNSYVNNISAEDKMTKIGPNIFRNHADDYKISLCSYSNEIKDCVLNIDTDELDFYKEEASYFIISADFQTSLPQEQMYGNGDYGIIVTCKYWNENTKEIYSRDYVIHAAEMIGQPYHFSTPNRQYKIFTLEKTLAKKSQLSEGEEPIKVQAFVNEFPVQNIGQQDDIFISNFECYFAKALTADELAGAALKIITPKGSRFTDSINSLILQAEVKVQGALVTNTKNINYYWFVRNLDITRDSEKYFYLGGDYWECLNTKASAKIDGNIGFTADVYKKTILKDNFNYSNISLKCVAVLDEYILSDIITITNTVAVNDINLVSKYGTTFPFDNYNSTITATVIRKSSSTDITNNCNFIWGYETEEGMIITDEFKDIHSNVLAHTPFGNRIKYLTTVKNKNDDKVIGSAEISLINEQQQPDYTLVLENGNQVFKYTVEGMSPTNQALPEKDRQNIQQLFFNLYNKLGESIGKRKENGIEIDERHKILKSAWYFPANNTVLLIKNRSTEGLIPINYNGKSYYKLENYDKEQLSFEFTIQEDKYNQSVSNNDIILEVQYKGLIYTASTNFTITKEGALGTNGTKYIARIVSSTSNVKQVFVHKNSIKCLKADGTIQNHNGQFNIQIWDGGTNAIYNSNTAHWEVLPKHSSIYNNTTDINVKYADYNIKLNNSTKGTIVSMNKNFAQNTTLQGWVTSSDLSRLPCNCYATYPIPVVYSTDDDICYIIEGGYNEVMYEEDGSRSNFNDTLPFKLKRIKISTQEVTEVGSARWYVSWSNSTIIGNDISIEPPSKLTGQVDNYIRVSYGNDYIIWSVHFYLNRYSMPSFNEWDGTGIEIDQDRNTILAPQIAAGKKNNEDNTFTGVAIGTTFNKGNSNNKDIGLFGYYHNARTIFLDATNGSATFGFIDGNSGCLEIKPSTSKNEVFIGLKESNNNVPQIKLNTDTQQYYLDYDTDKFLGAGIKFSANNNSSYIFFKDNFLIDNNANVFLKGTVYAQKGQIGGWTIDNKSLIGKYHYVEKDLNTETIIQEEDRQIELNLNNSNSPSLEGTVDDIQRWYIRGDGSFNFTNKENKENDDYAYIRFNPTYNNGKGYLELSGKLKGQNWYINHDGTFQFGKSGNTDPRITFNSSTGLDLNYCNLTGDSWHIYKNGEFKFGKGNTYIKFQPTDTDPKITIRANLQGPTKSDWYINEDGDFKLAGGALGYNIDSNHPGFYLKATQGEINLGSSQKGLFSIQYNGLPIQGRSVTPSTGNVNIWTKTCYQYPGLTVVNIMFYCSADTDDPTIVTGLPKPKHYLYVPIVNDDNNNVTKAQLSSSGSLFFSGKAIKDRNYYAIFAYTSED